MRTVTFLITGLILCLATGCLIDQNKPPIKSIRDTVIVKDTVYIRDTIYKNTIIERVETVNIGNH